MWRKRGSVTLEANVPHLPLAGTVIARIKKNGTETKMKKLVAIFMCLILFTALAGKTIKLRSLLGISWVQRGKDSKSEVLIIFTAVKLFLAETSNVFLI